MAHRPRLLVLLGAGASIPLGVPSTFALTKAVLKAVQAATTNDAGTLWSAPIPGRPSRLEILWQALAEAYPPPATNFEHLLHALEALGSLTRTWDPRTGPLFGIVEGVLTGGPRGVLRECFEDLWVINACDALFSSLHENIGRACTNLTGQEGWPTVASFLQNLESTFDLHIVTTNYDDVVERALRWGSEEQGFAAIPGEQIKRFEPPSSPARLMHLHGSIHLGYRNAPEDPDRFLYEDGLEDLYLHPSPGAALETWLRGSNSTTSQAGRETIIGPLVTGLQKSDKLLADPYLTYFRHFGELVATTPRLLIVGYGFGDVHINRTISRMNKLHGSGRRIAVIDRIPVPASNWEPSSVWKRERRSQAKAWPTQAFATSVARWSEEPRAMDVDTYPDPWIPTSSARDKVRVYFGGLVDTVRSHDIHLLDFLRS